MIRNEYIQGQTARVDITIRDSDTETLTDATNMLADVFYQGAKLATYTYGSSANLTKLSTGVYRLALDTSEYEVGIYRVQWKGDVETVPFLMMDKFEVIAQQVAAT